MNRTADIPIIALTIFLAGLSMMAPSLAALIVDDHQASRAFFYSGLLIIVFAIISGIAAYNVRSRVSYVDQLFGILIIFSLLPAIMAIPLLGLVEGASFWPLYLDMVSCLTTTGVALVELPAETGLGIAIWRAEVAWLGGYLILVAAVAVLEPLGLGGFEVEDRTPPGQPGPGSNEVGRMRQRMQRHILALIPWYVGATAVLWGLQLASGSSAAAGLVLAMSTISTSGITLDGATGPVGEFFILLFLVLALSRRFSTGRLAAFKPGTLVHDPELRIAFLVLAGAVLVVVIVNLSFLTSARNLEDAGNVASALWHSIFLSVSYLTTTGFGGTMPTEIIHGHQFRVPGFLLMLLAFAGGGIATTAGGLKLIRVFAMYRLGRNEMSRLVYPSTVVTSSEISRNIKVTGQEFAWIAIMVFALLLAFFMVALTASGLPFTEAVIITVAGLTTTGPLAETMLGQDFSFASLNMVSRSLAAAAMIFGRLELLTVIALFNPALWRGEGRQSGGSAGF